MNRVQNRLVDEQLENVHNQSSYNDFGCYFAESKTLELRPASTHEMTGETRSCVMGLRGAPARDFEAIRQSLQATPPYVVMMQQTMTASTMRHSERCAQTRQTRVAISYLTLEVVAQSRI